VQPKLVAEVAFAEWTQNGMLRQPRFEGLRPDKEPRECRRETPRSAQEDVRAAEAAMPAAKPALNGRKTAAGTLEEYAAKRNFEKTPEPNGAAAKSVEPGAKPRAIFVVQRHDATRLHFDFRLQEGGVLKSWAVTKEPSLDPAVKRLAVRVEDHPLSYAKFSGTIPEGNYGAGDVRIWDKGTFENLDPATSITEGLAAGKLSLALHGEKLHGRFALVRMRGKGKRENWLLIKGKDEFSQDEPREPTKKAPAARTTAKKAAPKKAAMKTAPAKVARASAKKATKKKSAVRKSAARPAGGAVITHPEKVIFPDLGLTKSDVAKYYRSIARKLLPFLKDRPISLERFPDGIGEGAPHFWQKNTPEHYPEWIARAQLAPEEGKTVAYVLVNDQKSLFYLVNKGALTFHPWLSRTGSLDRPDFVLFDLDRGEAKFADVVAIALKLREELAGEEREAFVKTSGKSGLHVLVPWDREGGFDEARAWATEVAERIAAAMPEIATLERLKDLRGGRVYLDVQQNARGKHVVPPYV
ncbi:MAG TPA: DNA polymerase ligase N-terminal domain-containing protein, partial [Planctomycetia bacterium]|nr:DNA polymerase ligase N-terminal domain-containing protein [Planctomycetia bacterium]